MKRIVMVTLVFLAQSTVSAAIQVNKNGLSLVTKEGELRVELKREDIARVYRIRSGTAPRPKSLSVVSRDQGVAWRWEQKKQVAVLTTRAMQVHMDLTDGTVSFHDRNGQIVEESATHPLLRRGQDRSWFGTLAFNLSPGEGIYGLGQHKRSELDYRGSTIQLRQENTEVAIPFLVSSRGYGIFWDNPAIADVSVDGPQLIDPEHLFSEDDTSGGLTGRYYRGMGFDTFGFERKDDMVDFDWDGSPGAPLGHEDFSVRWSGKVQTEAAGTYTFFTDSDDGIRLWVNGRLIIDNWTLHALATDSGMIHLDENTGYSVRLEYFQHTGGARIKLRWKPPTRTSTLTIAPETGPSDYYFFAGSRPDGAIAAYRWLTGEVPMLPKFALGLWQSKNEYVGSQDWIDVADGYRDRSLPLDVIVQDNPYCGNCPVGVHHFDETLYPGVRDTITSLHRDYHLRLLASVWPNFASGSANYDEMSVRGLLYPSPRDDRYYDAFNPKGRETYWEQIRQSLFEDGVDGWWEDATEPELTARWGEFRHVPTYLGIGATVYNAYPFMTARAVYEGQRSVTNRKRVVILTRSAYSGQQRTGAITWSGDIGGSFTSLRHQVVAGLNFSAAGNPFWTTDIGGYYLDGFPGGHDNPGYRELFVRWFQFGAFCPIFRIHGADTSRELWRFGTEAEAILAKYDRLRYRLIPYLYSLMWKVHSEGYTILRPLAMDYGDEQATLSISDQFMFGPAFLVSPILSAGQAHRTLYLPEGSLWYDFWSGTSRSGGQRIDVPSPLDVLPLWVPAGTILPLGPEIQYADQKSDEPVEIRVYPGKDGRFVLYDDDGISYDYERGRYVTIPFLWNDSAKRLTIGSAAGGEASRLRKWHFRVRIANRKRVQDVEYDGRPLEIRGF